MDNQLAAINLSEVLPAYLVPLFSETFITQILRMFVIVGLAWLVLSIFIAILRLVLTSKKRYIYLEVRPTYKALQSAFSTKQLFSILHSIDRPISFLERIVGVKQTISCELISTKESGIRYIVRVSEEDMLLFKKSFIAYLPGIEVKEVSDYLAPTQPEQYSAFKDFELSKSFLFPLQDQSMLKEHDPIAYITAQMTKLSNEELVAL